MSQSTTSSGIGLNDTAQQQALGDLVALLEYDTPQLVIFSIVASWVAWGTYLTFKTIKDLDNLSDQVSTKEYFRIQTIGQLLTLGMGFLIVITPGSQTLYMLIVTSRLGKILESFVAICKVFLDAIKKELNTSEPTFKNGPKFIVYLKMRIYLYGTKQSIYIPLFLTYIDVFVQSQLPQIATYWFFVMTSCTTISIALAMISLRLIFQQIGERTCKVNVKNMFLAIELHLFSMSFVPLLCAMATYPNFGGSWTLLPVIGVYTIEQSASYYTGIMIVFLNLIGTYISNTCYSQSTANIMLSGDLFEPTSSLNGIVSESSLKPSVKKDNFVSEEKTKKERKK
jgi:hypothetical protein